MEPIHVFAIVDMKDDTANTMGPRFFVNDGSEITKKMMDPDFPNEVTSNDDNAEEAYEYFNPDDNSNSREIDVQGKCVIVDKVLRMDIF